MKLSQALKVKLGAIVSDQVDALLLHSPEITQLQLSYLLGQCAHESTNFTKTRENLNYSAKGLVAVFPSHFKTLHDATPFERQPEKIANFIYANATGNGGVATGDGWKYRGGGYIGLTFKGNYQGFFKWLGLDINSDPELIASVYPLMAAHYYFTINKIYPLCTRVDEATCVAVTRKINKGSLDDIGFPARFSYTKMFYGLM